MVTRLLDGAASRELARSFERRMLPLAILFGVIVTLAPTLMVAALDLERARARADVYAQALATELGKDAARHPHVWPWRVEKTLDSAILEGRLTRIEHVVVRPCGESDEVLFMRGEPSWIAASSPVLIASGEIATITVSLDAKSAWERLLLVLFASALLGLGSSLALFHSPVRLVRRQAHDIEDATRALLDVRAQLEENNISLQARIDEAVAQVRELSSQVLRVQEEERARIARELHDGLAQELSAIRLDVERAMRASEDASLTAILGEASEQCEHALADLRHAIHDLRPVALDEATLDEVLRMRAERFEIATGVAVFLRVEGSFEKLPDAISGSLLRIVQEALHNIERHAQADEVGLTLARDAETISLKVRDDGVGFVRDPGEEHGHGLGNIHARAQLLGGSAQIESEPGQGTTLTVSLPVGSD